MKECICSSEGGGRILATLGSLVLLLFFVVSLARGQATSTFKGELADEQLNCIQTPVKAPLEIKDKTSCMLYLAHFVKPGSKYVLYDPVTKTTYKLDDQDLVQPYVGSKTVQITGTLDTASKTIKVKEIKALSPIS